MIIVGPGDNENNAYFVQLQKLIDQLKILDVLFLGTINDIPEILNTFDVFVNSSVYEGISNTILEAMANKIPVVASRVGGNPELIKDQESGLLFESKNENECAMCINTVIEDSEFSNILIDNAYQNIIANHSIDSMYNKNKELYQILYDAKSTN